MSDDRIKEIRGVISRVLNGESELRVSEHYTGELGELAKEVNLLLDKKSTQQQLNFIELPEEAKRVIDVLPMEVVIFDPDFRYRYVNPNAVKNPEIRKWIIGKNDFEYCEYRNQPLEIAHARQKLLQEAVTTGKIIPLDQSMVDKHGITRHYLRTVHPVFDYNGDLQHLIGCSYDVTSIKEKERELTKANEKLTKTTRELDQFVYRSSHDLRSPLVSIMGLVNLIQMENPSDQVMNYLGMVRRTVTKLDSFIREIVDHSKNSRQEIEYTKVEPEESIQQAVDELGYLRENAHFQIDVNVKQKASWVVDPFRTHVVLKNLISNAMKYQKPGANGDGRIQISIEVEPQSSKIIVEDNGIGIDPQYHDEVFRMFFRATNQSFGAGIGLYIAKEVLQRVDGTISLESAPDRGSKFTVLLPNHA